MHFFIYLQSYLFILLYFFQRSKAVSSWIVILIRVGPELHALWQPPMNIKWRESQSAAIPEGIKKNPSIIIAASF